MAAARYGPRTTSALLLWLLVVTLGVAFGAGLYEHRIVASTWLSTSADTGIHWNADAARQDDTGRRFWAFVTTGPLTLLTIANLAAAWRAPDPLRRWWRAAALLALADRVLTFSYFIPTMIALMDAPDTPESVATATAWRTFNYLRHAVVLAAWLCSLQAFAAVHRLGAALRS